MVIAAMAAILVMGLAVPAFADPVIESGSVTFVDINPCTGEEDLITINFVDEIHHHDGVHIVEGRRTGQTASGFIMSSGVFQVRDDGETAHIRFRDVWRNPTTGEQFHATIEIIIDLASGDEMEVKPFELRCRP